MLMVVDAPGRAARRRRRAGRRRCAAPTVPVLVAVNKVDRPGDDHLTAEFHGLGLGEPLAGLGHPRPRHRRPARPRSSPRSASEPAPAEADEAVRGRRDRPPQRRQVLARQRLPRLRAGDRLRVAPAPPATRSTPSSRSTAGASILVDTAGLRRRSKVAGTVDYYAQLRSERAVERADVAIVVCDASEGVTAEDLRVAEMAMRAGCATLLAAQQVGHHRAPTSTTPAPGSSASCACGRRSSPARRRAGATSPACCPRRWSSPTGPASGSRPRS